MILTRPRHRSLGRSRRRLTGLLLCTLALSATLAACTNSKLVIGPLYNRLDDRMRKQFNELGDFDREQTAMFEAAVGTAHVWHRQDELPKYASLIDEIASSIATPESTDLTDVTRWADAIEARAVAARHCHPVNYSFNLMQTLSDQQVDFIEEHIARERKQKRSEYEDHTPEERVERRLKNLDKWARRIGVELNAGQRALLRSGLSKQTSLRREYFRLSDDWKREFFRLAHDQDASDYDTLMATHFNALWSLLEDAYPVEWKRNRELWRDVAHRFVLSMTPEQRENASEWLATMADTLVAISADEPSFKVGDDPSIGCLVGTDTSGA